MAQGDKVAFSVAGGFYDSVFSIALSTDNPAYHIRYTTNGCEPTKHSPVYTVPLTLDERLYSTSRFYAIPNCPSEQFRLPDSVLRCIVIRAAVFDEVDSCMGPTATNSYFIKALGCETQGLPVVSLCADSSDLFDYERGIFVPGALFDPANPKWTGNYYQRGEEWERLCNVEFYASDNSGINQLAGLRTHGGNGRRFQQKTMKIYARKRYGAQHFNYRFFDDNPVEDFKHLVLRPFASNNTGITDYLCGKIAQQLNVDMLCDRPVVLFLNGEYWGIYFVKEKPDEQYVENHYHYDSRDVNVMAGWWGEAENGDADYFKELYHWMSKADLTDPKQYAHADSCIDIANFIDYNILEMFIANFDWPANNVRCWRVDGGKYRWIFFDGDSGLTFPKFDVFGNAVYSGEKQYPSSKVCTLFFRKLMKNKDFKKQFAQRFNELMTTVFAYKNAKPFYDEIDGLIDVEVKRQMNRFGQPEGGYPATYEVWRKYNMVCVNDFLKERPAHNFISLPEPKVERLHCSRQWFDTGIVVDIAASDFGPEEIVFYDLSGKQVFSQGCLLSQGDNAIRLSPDLPAGVYLVKVGEKVDKVVVM